MLLVIIRVRKVREEANSEEGDLDRASLSRVRRLEGHQESGDERFWSVSNPWMVMIMIVI